MAKRRVEVFTAGCPVCDKTVKLVKSLACPACEVVVYDLNKGCTTNECRQKAKDYGVERVPAVAVESTLSKRVGKAVVNGYHLEWMDSITSAAFLSS